MYQLARVTLFYSRRHLLIHLFYSTLCSNWPAFPLFYSTRHPLIPLCTNWPEYSSFIVHPLYHYVPPGPRYPTFTVKDIHPIMYQLDRVTPLLRYKTSSHTIMYQLARITPLLQYKTSPHTMGVGRWMRRRHLHPQAAPEQYPGPLTLFPLNRMGSPPSRPNSTDVDASYPSTHLVRIVEEQKKTVQWSLVPIYGETWLVLRRLL